MAEPCTVFGLLDTCNRDEEEFCIADVESLSVKQIEAAQAGKPAAKLFGTDAHVRMSDQLGTKLPDYVANYHHLLIVSKRIKTIIERMTEWPTEYIPLAIHDRKGKVASKDYFIVNPIGTFDALDLKKSVIEKLAPGVLRVHKMMLDWTKMKQAPDLFRPKEDPLAYIISKRLATPIRELKPEVTNRHYRDLWDKDDE